MFAILLVLVGGLVKGWLVGEVGGGGRKEEGEREEDVRDGGEKKITGKNGKEKKTYSILDYDHVLNDHRDHQ